MNLIKSILDIDENVELESFLWGLLFALGDVVIRLLENGQTLTLRTVVSALGAAALSYWRLNKRLNQPPPYQKPLTQDATDTQFFVERKPGDE